MVVYKLKLSVDLFHGLELDICSSEIFGLSIKEQEVLILLKANSKLKSLFSEFNLDVLAEKTNALVLHLHKPLDENCINWVCDCKH